MNFEVGKRAKVLRDDREGSLFQSRIGEVGEIVYLSETKKYLELVTLKIDGQTIAYWPSDLEVL